MTFERLWEILAEKRPGLRESEGSSVSISVASFKKQLMQAYKAGAVEQNEIEKLAKEFGRHGKPFSNLFGGMFG